MKGILSSNGVLGDECDMVLSERSNISHALEDETRVFGYIVDNIYISKVRFCMAMESFGLELRNESTMERVKCQTMQGLKVIPIRECIIHNVQYGRRYEHSDYVVIDESKTESAQKDLIRKLKEEMDKKYF